MSQDQMGIKTPEYVSLQFQLAGLGSRTAAFIIDQLILMAVNILVLIALFVIVIGKPTMLFFTEVHSFIFGITIVGLFILNWGYFFAFEYFSGGRTIGKRFIGIRVIQDNGHSLTLLSSLIRNLLRIIDSMPANYFLGLIMIFFHSKHKRIGDLVAGTIVVHERKAKRTRKQSAIEKEIKKRGLTRDDLILEEWALNSLGMKDWNLVKTYSSHLHQLPITERELLTKQMANILFPRIGLEMAGKTDRDLENILLVLYLILLEEWEYEL